MYLNNGICALIGDLNFLNLHFLKKISEYSTKELTSIETYETKAYSLCIDNKYYSTEITFLFFENTKSFDEWSKKNSNNLILALFIFLKSETITPELIIEYKHLFENTTFENQVNFFLYNFFYNFILGYYINRRFQIEQC